jgi:ATP-binding cassette subfamily C protein
MRLLLTFARAYPWRSGMTLVALLLGGLAEGVGVSTLLPILSTAIDADSESTGFIPDALAALGIAPSLGPLLGIMVTGIVIKSALVLLAQRQVGYTIAHIATDLRLDLIRALLDARWEYHLGQRIGGLANAAGTEVMRASQSYYHGARSVAYAIQSIVYIGVAIAVSWQAAVVCLGFGLLLMYAFSRLVSVTHKAGQSQTVLLKSVLSRLTDSLASVKPIKAMGRENLMGPILELETKELNTALRREVLSKEVMRAVQEPTIAALVAVALYVALIRWTVSPAIVMTLVFLLARALFQLALVQRTYQSMVVGESAYWSLQSTIKAARDAREVATGLRKPRLRQQIRMEQVSFAYGESAILTDVSLSIPAGSFAAITGRSGSGKTTIVDLISGLLQPDSGQIWIDDTSLEEVDLHAWRSMIGYVPQETGLLHDSVLNNVTLGDPRLTEQDVEAALRAAGAWQFVASLPDGLNSVVGERGAMLSGGQRQRIVIARALVHKPALLILDEATSALDHEVERDIHQALNELRSQMTILSISHRPNIETLADHVYRLEAGTLTLATTRNLARSRSR